MGAKHFFVLDHVVSYELRLRSSDRERFAT